MNSHSRVRFIIQSRLVTSSPLAIHSGLSFSDWQAIERPGQTNTPFRHGQNNGDPACKDCDQLVARDFEGNPYLPGSSLKGVLANYASRCRDEQTHMRLRRLLGAPSVDPGQAPKSQQQGLGGATIFEDGFLAQPDEAGMTECYGERQPWRKKSGHPFILDPADSDHLPWFDSKSWTYVEQMTSIDRRTGAVAEHKLYNVEAVPAGVVFDVQLVLFDCPSRDSGLDDARLLIQALAGFNLDPVQEPIQIGSNTNTGWGLMACLPGATRIIEWRPDGTSAVDNSILNVSEVFNAALAEPYQPARMRIQIGVKLEFESLFSVRDPSGVSARRAIESGQLRVGEGKAGKLADSAPRVAQVTSAADRILARPLLPASSFKGAFRTQMERIASTVHDGICVAPHREPDEVSDTSPPWVQYLFGLESRRSALWVSDFTGEAAAMQKREMVAIDRFTGGASDHAKFDVVAFDRPRLEGCLVLQLPATSDESDVIDSRRLIGLLALAFRDLIEGDITFGLGATKGFGHCQSKISEVRIAGFDLNNVIAELRSVVTSETTIQQGGGELTIPEGVISGNDDLRSSLNQMINLCLTEFRDETARQPASATV